MRWIDSDGEQWVVQVIVVISDPIGIGHAWAGCVAIRCKHRRCDPCAIWVCTIHQAIAIVVNSIGAILAARHYRYFNLVGTGAGQEAEVTVTE